MQNTIGHRSDECGFANSKSEEDKGRPRGDRTVPRNNVSLTGIVLLTAPRALAESGRGAARRTVGPGPRARGKDADGATDLHPDDLRRTGAPAGVRGVVPAAAGGARRRRADPGRHRGLARGDRGRPGPAPARQRSGAAVLRLDLPGLHRGPRQLLRLGPGRHRPDRRPAAGDDPAEPVRTAAHRRDRRAAGRALRAAAQPAHGPGGPGGLAAGGSRCPTSWWASS